MKKWLVRGIVLVLAFVLLIVTIFFFSTRGAAVQLSQSTSCEIRTDGLYHWFTDQEIPLVCSRDGHENGRVEFAFGLDWFRTAIFPTRDEHNLICFYQTDLTIALFVIDLEQSSGPDHSVPKDFFIPGPPIIKSTSFGLRRCTNQDVAHLKRYIASADDRAWHNSWVGVLPYLSNPTKQWLLTKIEHVTSADRVPSAGEIPAVRPE
jgi:hypothetical protein